MPRYMQIAADANKQVQKIVQNVDTLSKPQLVAELAYLYNLGIRTSPRPCQSTVRANAVRESVKGFPVSVSMRKVGNEFRSYNQISIKAEDSEPVQDVPDND